MTYIFTNKYRVQLPAGTKINFTRKDKNYFDFGDIYWRVSKKDETRDRRIRNNKLIIGYSVLYVDGFVIQNKDPIKLYNIVKELRKTGLCNIAKNDLEKNKLNAKWEELNSYSKKKGVNDIVNNYAENPFQFESFCKDIFKKQGYEVKQTPKTNDGGYDLWIEKDNRTSIVECKCYQSSHCISRPLLQKLVGANKTLNADEMIFITTSSYSKEAIDYAESVNMKLIDGDGLIDLINSIDINLCEREVLSEDWELVEEEIMRRYPKDIWYYNCL